MIITDGVHVVSTESEEELHTFARKVGLKRQWYQNHPRHPHYDIISPKLLQRAYTLGAEKVSGFDILKRAWWAQPRKEEVS